MEHSTSKDNPSDKGGFGSPGRCGVWVWGVGVCGKRVQVELSFHRHLDQERESLCNDHVIHPSEQCCGALCLFVCLMSRKEERKNNLALSLDWEDFISNIAYRSVHVGGLI